MKKEVNIVFFKLIASFLVIRKNTQFESLTTIYHNVAKDYQRFKTECQFIFLDFVLQKITAEFEEELEDEYLTDFRYNDLYDTFLNQELVK